MLPIPIQEMYMPLCRALGEYSEKSGRVGGEGTGYIDFMLCPCLL